MTKRNMSSFRNQIYNFSCTEFFCATFFIKLQPSPWIFTESTSTKLKYTRCSITNQLHNFNLNLSAMFRDHSFGNHCFYRSKSERALKFGMISFRFALCNFYVFYVFMRFSCKIIQNFTNKWKRFIICLFAFHAFYIKLCNTLYYSPLLVLLCRNHRVLHE